MLSDAAIAAIGAIGSTCILAAYLLITFQRAIHRLTGWRPHESTYAYHSINLVGGAFAGASAILTSQTGAIPLAALELTWALIACAGLAIVFAHRSRVVAPPHGRAAARVGVDGDERETGTGDGGGLGGGSGSGDNGGDGSGANAAIRSDGVTETGTVDTPRKRDGAGSAITGPAPVGVPEPRAGNPSDAVRAAPS